MTYLELALMVLSHLPTTRDRCEQAIDIRLALRYALVMLGDLGKVLPYLREAETLAETLNDHHRLGLISAYMALYCWVTADYDRTLELGMMQQAFAYPFMYWVGVNTPPDTDPTAVAEFNAFYTNSHVPEVMARGGYARGTRWELHRAFRHPQPGCPRFCAIYEADEAATQANQQRRSNSTPQLGDRPPSSGPLIWEKHDTL